ncbi:3-oxo-5-alpha-steroid 4-dehydrogenase-domain-containing protein [Chytriomyces cf. hyalinus JEL632]|nr:3-oxo-5-alpha-steroid 4-dehydrogenase-domain-containing protein [Chytriomyces cf. hyalinus JEL632]
METAAAVTLAVRLFYVAVGMAVLSLRSNLFGRQLRSLTEYGKTAPHTSHWLYVSKRLFTHFYVVGSAMSSILLLWIVALPFSDSAMSVLSRLPRSDTILSETDSTNLLYTQLVLASSMMLFQTLRRLFECLFVQSFSASAKMHVLHYLNGILFYSVTPVAMMIDGVLVLPSNGAFKFVLGSHQCLAVALFLYASVEQFKTHRHLAQLRTPRSSQTPSQAVYKLPNQGWFTFVACPHYLFEIAVYASFVVLYQGANWTTWAVFACVGVELGVAADQNREWYLVKFGDVLKGRRRRRGGEWKRLIPYLW